MKYIRLFENEYVIYSDEEEKILSDVEKEFLDNLPFKRGDYVRLKDKMLHNDKIFKIYEIKGISIDHRKNFANYSLFDLNNKFLHWFSAEKIEKIPDWEKDAMKYNL